MKTTLLSLFISLVLVFGAYAQSINSEFFNKVSYVGAFDGVTDWTSGWTNFDPMNTNYPEATITKGNGQFSRSSGLHISANETWSGVIKLDGWVYVDAGTTLTIDAGTIVRGTNRSVLVIERGAKIMAVGTQANPIVFTSNQGVGFRANSDWAGVVICGYGINNNAGGEGIAEGGIDSPYGGNDNTDNSGELQYVRIEFPGFEVAKDKEINGLTLYSVGDKTSINYVQVSYSGDDGFEWFGGAVNAKYLISYKTEDDDFDTDNGFVGMVQFGLVSRDANIVDTDAANAFESDNDAAGSNAEPFTHAVFSNISAFGPSKSALEPATLLPNHAGGSAMRLRRNTRLQIYNSVFMGWGMGLRLESDGSQTAANSDNLTVQNSIMAGIRGDLFREDGTVFDAATLEAWYKTTLRENLLLAENNEVMISDAFNYASLNFTPLAGSPVFNASIWNTTATYPIVASNETKLVAYPNPFSGSTNIELQLENPSNVRIFIMDMGGRTVADLQEGKLTAGKYRFVFDGTALPKGFYFAKVITDKEQKTVKMSSK